MSVTEDERSLFPGADPERPFFPDTKVQLSGLPGDAGFIIGSVYGALRRDGANEIELETFMRSVTSGDYDNVVQTAMRWVDVS